jgi:hypothetical protein
MKVQSYGETGRNSQSFGSKDGPDCHKKSLKQKGLPKKSNPSQTKSK